MRGGEQHLLHAVCRRGRMDLIEGSAPLLLEDGK